MYEYEYEFEYECDPRDENLFDGESAGYEAEPEPDWGWQPDFDTMFMDVYERYEDIDYN